MPAPALAAALSQVGHVVGHVVENRLVETVRHFGLRFSLDA
jgi:hypothetical protein